MGSPQMHLRFVNKLMVRTPVELTLIWLTKQAWHNRRVKVQIARLPEFLRMLNGAKKIRVLAGSWNSCSEYIVIQVNMENRNSVQYGNCNGLMRLSMRIKCLIVSAFELTFFHYKFGYAAMYEVARRKL
jgi:hypothetical protein